MNDSHRFLYLLKRRIAMIFESKAITLKDGREALFRAPSISDATELIEHLKLVGAETPYLSSEPEEYAAMTVEAEEKWIKEHLEDPRQLVIVVEIEGKIVGTSNLRFFKQKTTRHRAEIGISIQRAYWSLGIGSALFTEMIQAAKEYGTKILELSFLEGNDRAKALYERFDFHIIAEIPNAFWRSDGRVQKEYRMQKMLDVER